MNNSLIGQLGEQSVAQYLLSKKYTIVGNNFRTKFGEIDLIAIAPDKTLVFIEVKFFIGNVNSGLSPEDNMTFAKISKFKKVANYYAGLHPEYINEDRGWRLDVIALECPDTNALTNTLQLCKFRHYENI
jgi:putative endonuclease